MHELLQSQCSALSLLNCLQGQQALAGATGAGARTVSGTGAEARIRRRRNRSWSTRTWTWSCGSQVDNKKCLPALVPWSSSASCVCATAQQLHNSRNCLLASPYPWPGKAPPYTHQIHMFPCPGQHKLPGISGSCNFICVLGQLGKTFECK